jgi:hypothetical protein
MDAEGLRTFNDFALVALSRRCRQIELENQPATGSNSPIPAAKD